MLDVADIEHVPWQSLRLRNGQSEESAQGHTDPFHERATTYVIFDDFQLLTPWPDADFFETAHAPAIRIVYHAPHQQIQTNPAHFLPDPGIMPITCARSHRSQS